MEKMTAENRILLLGIDTRCIDVATYNTIVDDSNTHYCITYL
jgi:hypothetical protein